MSDLLSKFDASSIFLGPISFAQPVYDQITLEVSDDLEHEYLSADSIREVITLQSAEVELNSIPSSVVPNDSEAIVPP